MAKVFGELSNDEQEALRNAHDAGKTIELFNSNMDAWLVTYRPTFESDLSYRVADKQAPSATDIKHG